MNVMISFRVGDLLEHGLEPLLELTAARAPHRADVER
jgi:hypothetical protein